MAGKAKKTTKATKTTKTTKTTKKTPTRRTKARPFVKMHGIGNDAIILDITKQTVGSPPHLSRKLCNRHTGIGADQLILLTKSRKADFGARFFNPDGSEAEMCGNGIRCLARHIKDEGLSSKKQLKIETAAGIKDVAFKGKLVEVDMGEPRMKGKEIPVNLSGRVINRPLKFETKEFRITCLNVGNPHCVVFQENIDEFQVDRYGPVIEHHHAFPKRINVGFVNVLSRSELHMRIWERGVGETQGCGSAACAAAVASVLNGFTGRKVTIKQPGGKLEVEWNRKDNHIIMRGPADTVFRGEIQI
jgi:diaminopimelate epimerase